MVELMLAMGFISVLLLAIAMITLQISHTYTKGITLKEVNQAGLAISNDLQQTINSSSPFLLTDDGESYIDNDQGGRLCTGQSTYAWNYGDAIEHATKVGQIQHLFNVYDGPREDTEAIRFVKVIDPGKELCKPVFGVTPKVYPKIPDTQSGAAIDKSKTTEILAAGERNLVMYKFVITDSNPYPAVSDQRLYAISFRLGTGETEALDASGSCLPPANDASNQEYCAINTFDITARAGNHEVGGA